LLRVRWMLLLQRGLLLQQVLLLLVELVCS
jgi:hypothetical protein